MAYNGKSPTEINLAGLFGQASQGNLGQASLAKLERMAGGSGFGSSIAGKFLNKYQANQASTNAAGAAPQAPSVVQTAGATNIGQRINTIESRLGALEGSGISSNPASDVAPPADMSSATMPADTSAAAMPVDMPPSPQMPATQEPIIPQSEQLGSLMASPFTMRQRANMGPLMFKDQTGDGKITRADVIKARIEGYKK
jgi:hypothetical protein